MKLNYVKGSLAAVAIAGCAFVPGQKAEAAETIQVISFASENQETSLVDVIENMQKYQELKSSQTEIAITTKEEMQFERYMASKVFAKTTDGVLLVREEADAASDWVGKLYSDSAVEVIEKTDEWAEIQSGDVKGYVPLNDLIEGVDAITVGTEILNDVYENRDVLTLSEEEIDSAFKVGETREAEEARLYAEEQARIAAEQARIAAEKARIAAEKAKKGQSVVDYALQFVGNPYVYGGTSLTGGADCSGFVLKIYQKFGYSLPHSSAAIRGYGKEVSYSEAQAGDIICYNGHVAIYMGNGAIVHAANERKGITITYDACYQPIVTVRRMF